MKKLDPNSEEKKQKEESVSIKSKNSPIQNKIKNMTPR